MAHPEVLGKMSGDLGERLTTRLSMMYLDGYVLGGSNDNDEGVRLLNDISELQCQFKACKSLVEAVFDHTTVAFEDWSVLEAGISLTRGQTCNKTMPLYTTC